MNFTRKYRPSSFDEFSGNKSAVASIQSVLSKPADDIPRAWLLTGDSGCGKTTMARIIAKELNCDESCFFEYNAANTRGIDTIREVNTNSKFSPMAGDTKVYLFDEAHMITGVAVEALLKLIEDPPKNTYFIFATTNPEVLKKTLKSRCVSFHFAPLIKRDMKDLLISICDAENDPEFPEDVIDEIISASQGLVRAALQLLDMVFLMEDIDEMIAVIQSEDIDGEGDVKEICQGIMKKVKWSELASILKNIKGDPESLRRGILGYFNAVLLNSGDPAIAFFIECFEENYFNSGRAGLTKSCFIALTE